MLQPTQFASNYAHTKLYRAYDKHPEIWKPAVFRYTWQKGENYNLGERYLNRLKPQLIESTHPHDFDGCDWTWRYRWKPAFRYVIHSSCQYLSIANLVLANLSLPGSKWFHVADNDMNEGQTHHYVMNEKGQVLDAQGLHLQFDIKEYQKTFSEDKISNEDDIMDQHWFMCMDYEEGIIT